MKEYLNYSSSFLFLRAINPNPLKTPRSPSAAKLEFASVPVFGSSRWPSIYCGVAGSAGCSGVTGATGCSGVSGVTGTGFGAGLGSGCGTGCGAGAGCGVGAGFGSG